MRLSPNTPSFELVLGMVFVVAANSGCSKPAASPAVSTGAAVSLQPEHPVTPEMSKEAAKMDRKIAPEFKRQALSGEGLLISGKQGKPQFVLFILDGCPCSEDAQPIFNGFSKLWKDKVEFIGVIDSAPNKAKIWVSDYRPNFPVISDPKKEIIKAYHAKQSVYSALISREGQIVKLWPGYSTDLLQEMNKAIAKELGEEPIAFDTQYAPKQKTSGCYF
jgi:peroxiredoxin